MAKKPLNAATEWLNRYSFWRGQYQVRNPGYIALENEQAQIEDIFKQFDSRKIGFKDNRYVIYDLWGETILCTTDPIENYNLPAELTAPAIRSRELLKMMDEDYPYASEFIDALDIYYSIHAQNFPPNPIWCEDNENQNDNYCPDIPFSFDKNDNKILNLKIDCSMSTTNILAGVLFQVERYKKFLADTQITTLNGIKVKLPDELLEPLMAQLKREIKKSSKANFRASDSKRAIGLMVYDWLAISPEESLPDAFRSVQTFIADRIGWQDTPEIADNWRSYYENANDCIKSGEILEILRK